jgi:hypothetical protein
MLLLVTKIKLGSDEKIDGMTRLYKIYKIGSRSHIDTYLVFSNTSTISITNTVSK